MPVVGICAIYLIARSLGKYFGARWGCAINKTHPNVKNYLGLTLLPQAGVAIGMARSASNTFLSLGEHVTEGKKYFEGLSSTILAVVLCATLVYELFGPLITKASLIKAGEINKETK